MHNSNTYIPENSVINMDRFISTLTPEYERYLDGYSITADLDSFTHSTSFGSIDPLSIV